jgi:hypothetical protein
MAMTAQKITPCLWFDTEAEEAANLAKVPKALGSFTHHRMA